MATLPRGVYAPSYYKEFRCTAEKCRHSCCVGWEIGIDRATYEKYKQLGDILPTVEVREGSPCFALTEDGRCPHLNKQGLCKIILSHGEEYLAEICREHPRFYHELGDRVEVGLGIVCEEACRLLLESEPPFSPIKIGESGKASETAGFDPRPARDMILSTVGGEGSFASVCEAISEEFRLPPTAVTDAWIECFLSLEILDPAWEKTLLTLMGRALPAAEEYSEQYKRLLAYFVYRHVSLAESEINLRARLAFALLSVQLIASLHAAEPRPTPAGLADLSRRYSAEIEYSEENTDAIIFELESTLL